MNPVQNLTPHFFKKHFNSKLKSMPRSFKCYLSSSFPTKVMLLTPRACYLTCTSHYPPWFYRPSDIRPGTPTTNFLSA